MFYVVGGFSMFIFVKCMYKFVKNICLYSLNSLTDRQIARNLARPGYPVQYSSIDKDLESVSTTTCSVPTSEYCVL